MSIGKPTSTMTELYKRAQSKIPATISLPSQWLRSYEDFVTRNATSVGQIESTLRSLTYLIPGPRPSYRVIPLANQQQVDFAKLNWPLKPVCVLLMAILDPPAKQASPHIHPPLIALPYFSPPAALSLPLPPLPTNPLHSLLHRTLTPLFSLGDPPANDPIYRTAMRNVLQAPGWRKRPLEACGRVRGHKGNM